MVKDLPQEIEHNYSTCIPALDDEISLTELDEGILFTQVCSPMATYCMELGELFFDGCKWIYGPHEVENTFCVFLDNQMRTASKIIEFYNEQLTKSETKEDDEILKNKVKIYTGVRRFFRSLREDSKIKHIISRFKTAANKPIAAFDKDPFLLNTPGGMIDLKTGEITPCDPYKYCTMSTTVSLSDNGKKEWDKFLNTITCNDEKLKGYLQTLMGLCCIGKMFDCGLYYAFGNGGNGKSTFFNVAAKVLGDYAVSLSSSLLSDSNDTGKKFSLANLKGKRYALVPEIKRNVRLDDAMLKIIASNDMINAEHKHKDAFVFWPSHTSVVYSNYLPLVEANDQGVWDRIRVVPFSARIRGTTTDVKNMPDKLYEECGGAALAWMVEGAQRFISQGYRLDPEPKAVIDATENYRRENDLLYVFRRDLLEDGDYETPANEVLLQYNRFLVSKGQKKQIGPKQLKAMLERCGYEHGRNRNGSFYRGFRIIENMGA